MSKYAVNNSRTIAAMNPGSYMPTIVPQTQRKTPAGRRSKTLPDFAAAPALRYNASLPARK
jgi:hypothetical protein